jgi:hypothetical protein
MRRNFLLSLLCSLFGLTFLIGCSTAPLDYVAADSATYRAIAPEYLDYVIHDPALSQDEKDSRNDTVELWRTRVEAGSPTDPFAK